MDDPVRTVFKAMPKRFKKGVLDKDLSFYFSLGDHQKWTVHVGTSTCKVEEGKKVEQADCVLKTSPELFLRMVTEGYVPGIMDFTAGRVKSNDPMLLKELKAAFGW